MEKNGKIYCDECNLAIEKQQHVRLPRPKVPCCNPNGDAIEFSHWHNRHTGDCWSRAQQKAKTRAEARKPSAEKLAKFARYAERKVVIQ